MSSRKFIAYAEPIRGVIFDGSNSQEVKGWLLDRLDPENGGSWSRLTLDGFTQNRFISHEFDHLRFWIVFEDKSKEKILLHIGDGVFVVGDSIARVTKEELAKFFYEEK